MSTWYLSRIQCRLRVSPLPNLSPRSQFYFQYRSFSRSTPTMKSAAQASAEPALDFVKFLNASPTPFHAVKDLKDRFTAAGFEEIRERDDWAATCKPGGKYFLTRNASTIVAFAVGAKWKPGELCKIPMLERTSSDPFRESDCYYRRPYRLAVPAGEARLQSSVGWLPASRMRMLRWRSMAYVV